MRPPVSASAICLQRLSTVMAMQLAQSAPPPIPPGCQHQIYGYLVWLSKRNKALIKLTGVCQVTSFAAIVIHFSEKWWCQVK